MLLKTILTGGTHQLFCPKPIFALLLVCSGKEAIGGDQATNAQIFDIYDSQISALINSKNGKQVDIFQEVKTGAVASYTNYGEGMAHWYRRLGNNGEPDQESTVKFILKLTDGAAIGLALDEDIQVTFDNFPSYMKVDVYGLEHPVRSNSLLDVSTVVIQAAVGSREIEVDNIEAVVFPIMDKKLKRIALTYSNGIVTNYTLEELIAMNGLENKADVIVNVWNPNASPAYRNSQLLTSDDNQVGYLTYIVKDATRLEVFVDTALVGNGTFAFTQVSKKVR